jgi:hypothetical protein
MERFRFYFFLLVRAKIEYKRERQNQKDIVTREKLVRAHRPSNRLGYTSLHQLDAGRPSKKYNSTQNI